MSLRIVSTLCKLLDWCQSNCRLSIVEIYHLILEYILNIYVYVIPHFNIHFSLYILLLMTLLAVYFIFILDYRNDVRQKVNLSNFFFKFKIGLKTEETACNINSNLTQELLMNVQCSGDSRTRGLKMRNTVAGHWKLTTTN